MRAPGLAAPTDAARHLACDGLADLHVVRGSSCQRARVCVKTHQILMGTWSLAKPHYHSFFWGKNTEDSSPELEAIKIASRFGLL